MIRHLLGFVFLCTVQQVMTQSIIANPDGTHSVVHDNSPTSTGINPNGTHSVIFNNGNTSIMVNPDGTHSVVVRTGNISTIANTAGSHSMVVANSNTAVMELEDSSSKVSSFFKKKEIRVKKDRKSRKKDNR